MRRGAAAVLIVALLGGFGLLLEAALDERELAFSVGAEPALVVAELRPGERACQAPIEALDDFAGARFQVGTYRGPGQPLLVTVERVGGGRLAGARLGGGYEDNSRPAVRFATVPAGRRVRLCVRNAGSRQVALYGGPELSARRSSLFVEGRPRPYDLSLVLLQPQPRSALSLLPDMFERAALWHPGWVGPWTFWLLLALVLLGPPVLLAAAVVALPREEEPR